jgi:hypothetical protein
MMRSRIAASTYWAPCRILFFGRLDQGSEDFGFQLQLVALNRPVKLVPAFFVVGPKQEIRFVFGADPAITKETNGGTDQGSGKNPCSRRLTSEEIPKDEADLICDLLAKIKAGELPGPEYPAKHQELWDRQLALAQGSPFTAQDNYPELFPRRSALSSAGAPLPPSAP